MKPLKLTMKAFGSYAQKTTLDFTRLPQGVYLITGETGAGKTTIFDAIVFALFGTASGSDRDPSMMHSDYVSRGEDTEVTLVYQHNGRTYTVTRTLHYAKSRSSKDGYSPKAQPKAVMEGEGMTSIEGPGNVSAKSEELLGLDARQFRQIIMLAQGEFRAFLEADTSKREAILSRLFDDTRYRAFQEVLKAAEDRLLAERKDYTSQIEYAMHSFDLTGLTDEEKAKFDPAYPDLVGTLEDVVAGDRAAEAEAGEAYTKADSEAVSAARAVDAAKAANGLLDQLEAKQKELHSLRARQGEIDALRESVRLCDLALHEIRPREEAVLRAGKALEDTEADARRLEEEIREGQSSLAALIPVKEAAEGRREEGERLKVRASELEKTLPQYAEKNRLLGTYRKAERELNRASGNLEAARGNQEKLETRLKEKQAFLESVKDADVLLEKAKTQKKEAEGHLSQLQSLMDDVKKAKKVQKDWQKSLDALQSANADAEKAEAAYHRVVEDRIAAQAGELGVSLKREMEETGEALCPVCHAHYVRGDAVHFAEPSASDPTREDVEAAQKAMQAAQSTLRAANSHAEGLSARFEEMKGTAQSRAAALGLADEWVLLSDETALKDREKEEKALLEEKTEACRKAQETVEQKQAAEREAAEIRAEQEEKQQTIRELDQAVHDLGIEVPSLKAKADAIHLDFESLEEAEKAMHRAQAEAKAIDDAIRRAQDDVTRTEKQLSEMQGRQATLVAQAEKNRADLMTAREAFAAAVDASEFADEAAYRSALEPAGTNGEGYLKQSRNAITAFDTARTTAEQTEQMLRGQVGEHTGRADVEALEKRSEEAVRAKGEAREKHTQAASARQVHENILESVRKSCEALRGTDEAFRHISGLSELANRDRATGSILTFSRYVLTYVFREILQAANQHLDTMSGGKYELVYRRMDNNAAQLGGLNMNVLDHITGEQRDVKSLSGGESFEVSMSLALGLSSVVQARSGALSAEAMFVDEGFGSLGERELNAAMDVLSGLSGDTKQIGIISHVARLEECIPAKVRVTSGKNGSSLSIE